MDSVTAENFQQLKLEQAISFYLRKMRTPCHNWVSAYDETWRQYGRELALDASQWCLNHKYTMRSQGRIIINKGQS